MTSIRLLLLAAFHALLVLCIVNRASADTLPTVHFIGASYAGQFETIPARFPYTTQIDSFGRKGQKVDVLTGKLLTNLADVHPLHYTLSTEQIQGLKNTDQALDLTFLVSEENVLQTSYNINGQSVYKVLAQVRAQALYFDVLQSALVRELPLSFAQISTFDHQPTHAEVARCVELALFGDDGISGLLGKFVSSVTSSPYPVTGTKFFKVKSVIVDDKVLEALAVPQSGVAAVSELQNQIADTFAETFSADQGVSFIPYTSDYLIGNRIPLSLSNGDAFSLKLPTADYNIDLHLLGAKRILFGQSVAGKSLIYGTLFHVRLIEPISGQNYLDADFKNGVVVKVPASQTSDSQNDQFAYDDSMRELFEHLSHAISAGGTNWSSKASSTADIKTQFQTTRDLFQSCK